MFTITLVVTLMAITNIAVGYGLAVYLQRSLHGAWLPSLSLRKATPAPASETKPAAAPAATKNLIADEADDLSEQEPEIAQQEDESLESTPAPAAVNAAEPVVETLPVEPEPPQVEPMAVESVPSEEATLAAAVEAPQSAKPEIEDEVLAGIEAFREQLAKMSAQPDEPGDDPGEAVAEEAAVEEEETTVAAVG